MFYDLLIFIFMSYIKPQLIITTARCQLSYISYYSYIKPQLFPIKDKTNGVVYRTIPTSNHNLMASGDTKCLLYIVLFLHQTTTLGRLTEIKRWLYIILFLHQTTTSTTTTSTTLSCISYYSYIKPQLLPLNATLSLSCISYYSYIKPQPVTLATSKACVVYHTIPTSNHNIITDVFGQTPLYIILFLHQTTTYSRIDRNDARLYIILFLHQTTTPGWCLGDQLKLYIILFLHQTTT